MILDATDIRISVAGRLVAALTEASFSYQVDTRETTRFITGAAKTFVPSASSWQISGSSFITYPNGYSFFNLFKAIRQRQIFEVAFLILDPVSGFIELRGNAILTSLASNGSTGQDMKMNFTLQGTGDVIDNAAENLLQLTTYIRPSSLNRPPVVQHLMAGENVILKAPEFGRRFMNWRDTGGTVLSTNPQMLFTMPSANKELRAWYFERAVTIKNNPNATIYYNNIAVIQDEETYSFPDNIPIEFYATTDEYHEFSYWMVTYSDGEQQGYAANPHTQLMHSDFTIEAIVTPL
jgi:hypothetical protein